MSRRAGWVLGACAASLVAVVPACSGAHHASGGTAPAPTAFPAQPDAGDCDVSGGGVPGVGDTGPTVNGAAPTVPPGVDVGPTGSGLGSGNPYTVVGARPVPGPDMPATTLASAPTQQVVASPPNPDVGTPANLVPGETVAPRAPTTSPPKLAPSSTSPPTTGLMSRSGKPDCVLSPGDP